MYTKDSVPLLPRTFGELMSAIINIANSCATGAEAGDLLQNYLVAVQPHFTLSPSMATIRAKAYAAAEQRRATIPFELRWRGGSGELVYGWDNLIKKLREYELRFKLVTLRSMLSGGKRITRSLINPETGLLDIFEVRRTPKIPKPIRGRPQGSSNVRPRETIADKVEAIDNPNRNKMRGRI